MRIFTNWINQYQDILAFMVVFMIVIIACFVEKRKNIMQFSLAIYIFCVFYKTVISRRLEITDVNLELGWSYRALVRGVPGMFSQIYLNIMLFVPIGALGEGVFLREKKICFIPVALGLVLTIIIECIQFMLHCGTFELDDILNNLIGTIAGIFIVVIIKSRMRNIKR